MANIGEISRALSTLIDSVNLIGKVFDDRKIDFTDIHLGLQLAIRVNDLAKSNFTSIKEEALDLDAEEIQALLELIGKKIDLPVIEQSQTIKSIIVELSICLTHLKSLYTSVQKIKAAV